MNIVCSKCGEYLDLSRIGIQSYCKDCHNEYSRQNRKKHSQLSESQKKKANARSYLNVYVKRGVVKKQKCYCCGSKDAEAHHEDYSKPLEVIWLCRPCHLDYHSKTNNMVVKQAKIPIFMG